MTDGLPARFSAVLAALRPPWDAPDGAWEEAFRRTAERLLNGAVLWIAGQAHRITEVEFYYRGGQHRDPFAHCDPMQQEDARWYFHRTGGTYRGGTYKGLDVTFGTVGAYGGILLRGMVPVDHPMALRDGPSVCVDHILNVTGVRSVTELAARFDLSADAPAGGTSPLWIECVPSVERVMYASARVGLSLRRGATPERLAYLARPYRYLTEPSRIRKGRAHLVVALHARGWSLADIVACTGVLYRTVARWIEAYEDGRGRCAETLPGPDAGTVALCRVLGACAG